MKIIILLAKCIFMVATLFAIVFWFNFKDEYKWISLVAIIICYILSFPIDIYLLEKLKKEI